MSMVQVQVGEVMLNKARCACTVHLEFVKYYL